MIRGLGCDIVQITRLTPWCFSKAMLMKVFTHAEIALLPSFVRLESEEPVSDMLLHRASEQLAGMFSAKEAYKKAVGTLYRNIVSMKDIIVEKNINGSPRLTLKRTAAEALLACSARDVFVSISHEKQYAIATVIIS